MRKAFILLSFFFLGKVMLFAQQQVLFFLGFEDPTSTMPGGVKAPPRLPMVEQDGDDLTFETGHAAFTLQLIQDDEVIYSVAVPDTTTLVTLPSWIEGECEIRLLTGGIYYFYGYITL